MTPEAAMVPESPRTSSIAIVIPCHSELRFDRTCIAVQSGLQQSLPADKIIVVVDHNPSLRDRLRAALPEVTVIENLLEAGASGARNTGAKHGGCDYTLFLDDDVRAEPQCLSELVAAMEQLTMTEPSSGNLFQDNGRGDIGVGARKVPSWEGSRPRWLPPSFDWVIGVSYEGLPTDLAEVRNIWSDCMLVRTKTFLEVGGFRTGFGKIGDRSAPEDTELCLRMKTERDVRWFFQPSAVAWHYVPKNRCTYWFFVRRCFNQGREKARLRTILAGSPLVLTAESHYARKVLTDAIKSEARQGSNRQQIFSVLRIGTVSCGLIVTICGYAVGRILDVSQRVQAWERP